MYGFWGEGHTSDYASPFPDSLDRRAHLPRHDRAADRRLEARAPRREHPARHQPHRQPRGAGPGGARRGLAALGQHHPRRADPDRGARQPAAVARGGDGGRLPPPLPHGRPSATRVDARGRRRDRAHDAPHPRPRRELLVALDRGGEPRALPRARSPLAFDALAAAPRLSRAAVVGLAAQALRRRTSSWWPSRTTAWPACRACCASSRRRATGRCAPAADSTPGIRYAGRLRQASFVLPARAGRRATVRLRAEIETQGRAPAGALGLRAAARRRTGALAVRLQAADDAELAEGSLMTSAGVVLCAVARRWPCSRCRRRHAAEERRRPRSFTRARRSRRAGPRITPYLRVPARPGVGVQDDARRAALRAGAHRGRPASRCRRSCARRCSTSSAACPRREDAAQRARHGHACPMDGYRIEKVVFESLPGLHVTALVYVPDAPARAASPPCCSPAATRRDGKASAHYQEIARTPRAPRLRGALLGSRRPGRAQPVLGRARAGAAATTSSAASTPCSATSPTLAGTSLVRYMVWDGMRAVDYLLTRADVDAARIAVTGTSGGGFQSTWIGALDERIQRRGAVLLLTSLPDAHGQPHLRGPGQRPRAGPSRPRLRGRRPPGPAAARVPAAGPRLRRGARTSSRSRARARRSARSRRSTGASDTRTTWRSPRATTSTSTPTRTRRTRSRFSTARSAGPRASGSMP